MISVAFIQSAGYDFSMQDSFLSHLKKAALSLSERYRKGDKPYLRSEEDRKAYLITRLPATQAVLRRVLQEIDNQRIDSYLDIGAGPGGSWDPVTEKWPELKSAEFIEIDFPFIALGQQRLAGLPIQWHHVSATKQDHFPAHDLVLFSYSWGEILSFAVLEKAWLSAHQFLVIIEPGTPKGFAAILQAREFLLKKNAFIVAPCPHHAACPLAQSSSWCHFGTRLERSWEHQWMKKASLGYEDEKYSYLIVAKTDASSSDSRLLKDPVKKKGHLQMLLCTAEGIQTQTVTKSQGAVFKACGKLGWGDKISLNR